MLAWRRRFRPQGRYLPCGAGVKRRLKAARRRVRREQIPTGREIALRSMRYPNAALGRL